MMVPAELELRPGKMLRQEYPAQKVILNYFNLKLPSPDLKDISLVRGDNQLLDGQKIQPVKPLNPLSHICGRHFFTSILFWLSRERKASSHPL